MAATSSSLAERAQAAPPIAQTSIAQTSLATRGTNPGEVTVRFRKWATHGMTAYQRGQYAGFPIGIALQLEAEGAVDIDPSYARGASDRMIRK